MDYISAFSDYMLHELNRNPATVEAYLNDIGQFVTFLGRESDAVDMTAVTPDDVNVWLASLSATGLTISTIRRKLQSLRTFYRFMIRRRFMEKAPTADIEVAHAPKRLPSFVPDDEMRRVFREINDDYTLRGLRDRLILEVLYCLGLRRAELIGLNDADIDFDRGTVTVLGKRGKTRLLPVPQELLDEIARYRRLRDEELPDRTGGALFVGRHGDRLRPGPIQTLVNRALSSVDAEHRSPHLLRHSFATSMLNNGADINALRELMGHSRLSTTQIYTHLTDRELRENYDAAHPRAKKK